MKNRNDPRPRLPFHASKHYERRNRQRTAIAVFLLIVTFAIVAIIGWLALQ